MSRSLIFIFFLFCLVSCGADKSFLEKYYIDNPALHSEMRDSLVAFSKQYNRKVYLKKNTAVSDDINLYIFFDDIPGYTPIVYDSALQRRDYDLTRTEGLIVPKGLVENFKSSAYHFISCENGQVFFGYKQDNQEIFAREVAFIGILTPFTGEVGKESKRISSDAVITNRYSP